MSNLVVCPLPNTIHRIRPFNDLDTTYDLHEPGALEWVLDVDVAFASVASIVSRGSTVCSTPFSQHICVFGLRELMKVVQTRYYWRTHKF